MLTTKSGGPLIRSPGPNTAKGGNMPEKEFHIEIISNCFVNGKPVQVGDKMKVDSATFHALTVTTNRAKAIEPPTAKKKTGGPRKAGNRESDLDSKTSKR